MAGAAPTAKPAPFLKPLDLVDRGILLAESSLSVVVVTAMVIFGASDAISSILAVISRFWWGFNFLYDLVRDLFLVKAANDVLMHGTLWAAFLGASFATRGRKHLMIDAIGRNLPDRARRILAGVANTFGSVVAATLGLGIYQSLSEQALALQEQIEGFERSGILDATVDRSYEFQFIIPVGFLMIAIRLLLHGFHELLAVTNGYSEPSIDPPPAPAADESTIHEEPDGAPSIEGDESRVAPVDQANATEIGIACLVLLLPIIVASTSHIAFGPLLVGCVASMLLVAIPLGLRYRAGSLIPPAPLPDHYAHIDSPYPPLAAMGGVLTVLFLTWLASGLIPVVPTWLGVAFFGVVAFAGAPLFTFLGGLALFLWMHGGGEVPILPLSNTVEDVLGNHFARLTVLPTIPVFTMAGYLMSEAKTAPRLVRVARSLLGWMPGGLAIVCILVSCAFTVFSGASGVTIVAIGGLLLPALLRDKYPEGFSLGLVASGGKLGITFFPCVPLIVYGIVAGLQEMPPGMERVQLPKMIIAGILPQLLILGMLMAYAVVVAQRSGVPTSSFDFNEAKAALWEAKWELILPTVVLLGFATSGPLGAASLTAAYVFIIEVFVYKDLSLTKDIPRVIPDSMVLVGAIFVKLCAATVLTFYFVQARTADALFEVLTCGPPAQEFLAAHSDVMNECREAVTALAERGISSGGIVDSQLGFLLTLNFFLLIVGMLMDGFSAIVVFVPLIMGIAIHFGINPYHLGVVFLINVELGYLMPPLGLNLFIAGFRFGKPVSALFRPIMPFVLLFTVALGVLTYIPWFSTAFLPEEPVATLHRGPALEESGDSSEEAAPLGGDCDVPREDESFEAFGERCSGDNSGGGGGGAAAGCDVPSEGESFEAFMDRCLDSGGGSSPTTDAPEPEPEEIRQPEHEPIPLEQDDCVMPRDGESYPAFEARCNG